MEDSIKKLIYTGIGAATNAVKKLQDVVDDVVVDGKISQEEGKKVINDWKKNFDAKKAETEVKLNDIFNTTYNKVTGQKKIEELEKALRQTKSELNYYKNVVRKSKSNKKTPRIYDY